jgi:hypothetical protein
MKDGSPAKLRNGELYTGNQQFAGQGMRRSCGKCNTFVLPSKLKKRAPWGMCCEKCRGQG